MHENNELSLFGRTIACECGKTHRIEPREVVYARDALDRLPGICAQATTGRRVAVLTDSRTHDVAGAAVCVLLKSNGWKVSEVLVPDPLPGHSPVCDDVTLGALLPEFAEVDLVVPVGSGVLNDLGKWASFKRGVPFICVPTAASMNGYASPNVAPTIANVKTLVRAHAPVAIVGDPAILENAPWEMTASGLGDILAKPVSSADWRLNHVLFGDYYCARAVGLIEHIEPLYLDHAEDLPARSSQAIKALFDGLLLTGVAMNMAETSSPSSGGEHMIGHTLDMMSFVDGAEHDLHGRQVGVGTVLAAELYQRVLAMESPVFSEPCRRMDHAFWGKLGPVVAEHYSKKIERLDRARHALAEGSAWDALREELSPMMRSPQRIHDCLMNAHAAYRAEHIKCDRWRLLDAFDHAHEIRARFTILDLARLVGILPNAAPEIVDAWAS